MIKKRNKVFETNSSSVHTVTIAADDVREKPNFLGETCKLDFREFGWDGDCSTWRSKLAYLAQLVFECIPWEEKKNNNASMCDDKISLGNALNMLESNQEYRHLKDIVCNWINADDLTWSGCGYIDHQSYEDYKNLDDWLKDHGLDSDDKILDFIFGDSYIEISNDNGDW